MVSKLTEILQMKLLKAGPLTEIMPKGTGFALQKRSSMHLDKKGLNLLSGHAF